MREQKIVKRVQERRLHYSGRMELNIATLTAPTLAAPTDLLSLLQTSDAAPAVSTDSSAPIAQDLSALLTEMIGPVAAVQAPALPQIQAPALPQVPPLAQVQTPALPEVPAAPKVQPKEVAKEAAEEIAEEIAPVVAQPTEPAELPALPEIVVSEPKGKEPQKAPEAQKVEDVQPASPSPFVLMPFVPVAVAAAGIEPAPTDPIAQPPETAPEPVGAGFTPAASRPTPELERAFAEVRKFELAVQQEVAKPETKPLPALPAPAEAPKQALITTDPIANVQQQQLPPRVVAIQKIAIEAKFPERSKPATTASSDTTTTTTPSLHFSDAARTVEHIEQVRAAHQVEIPELPKFQVVRTVAMQVGDADSQVTIRIQERGGDLTMQLNTGSEPLRQDLQSSIGSLVQALKQEQIQVSNVEVSRKAPIDKVRRMKEAR